MLPDQKALQQQGEKVELNGLSRFAVFHGGDCKFFHVVDDVRMRTCGTPRLDVRRDDGSLAAAVVWHSAAQGDHLKEVLVIGEPNSGGVFEVEKTAALALAFAILKACDHPAAVKLLLASQET